MISLSEQTVEKHCRDTTHLGISTVTMMAMRYCDEPIRITTVQTATMKKFWHFLISKQGFEI